MKNEKKNEKTTGKTTGKTTDLNNPHDGGFKDFFSQRSLAQSFFKENLPVAISKHLDYRTLKISKDSFIDEHSIPSQSDLLYEIKYKKHPLLLYLLFEHKSYQDWLVSFQVLKYLVRIWELYMKQHPNAKKLPAILPLVIYHGKSKWAISKHFNKLIDAPLELKPFIPDFEYLLYDVSHLPDEEIKGIVILRMILLMFKYTYNPDLHHKLFDIFNLYNEIKDKKKGLEYVRALVKYVLTGTNTEPEVIRGVLDKCIKHGGDIVQTTAQKLRQEGRQVGRQEGRQEERESNQWLTVRNSLSVGISVDNISKITGLSIKQIKQMIATINNEAKG